MSTEGDTQFSDIWEAAKLRYVASTKNDLDALSLANVVDVESLKIVVLEQNDSFKTFRKKMGRLWNGLEIVCKPLSQIESMASAAAEGFPPAKACFKAMLLFIKAANGVSESYDAVAELLETLGDVTIRLQIYRRHSMPPEFVTKLVEILATLLDILARSTKVISDGGIKHRLISFGKNILLGSDKTLQKLLEHLGRLVVAESRLLGAEAYSATRQVGRQLESVSASMDDNGLAIRQGNRQIDSMSSAMHQINIKQDELVGLLKNDKHGPSPQAQNECLKSTLQPSALSEDRFQSIDRSRVPRTGDWIWSEVLFQKWQAGNCPILWLCGNPGHGKSYVCGNVVSALKLRPLPSIGSTAAAAVAYFFFRAANPETRSVINALKTMAFQLCQTDIDYSRYIGSCALRDADLISVTSAWRVLFVEYFFKKSSPRRPVFVVLDGLDEAFEDERFLLLELLQDVSDAFDRNLASDLRVLMSGRLQVTDEVHSALGESTATIQIDRTKNEGDIENYVRNCIQKSRTLRTAPSDIRSLILRTITTNADGMFLWCDLMMRELLISRRTSSIKEALQSVPKGLEEVLTHVLETFSETSQPDDAEDLNEILRWVSVASVPLDLDNLSLILASASPDGAEPLDLEGRLRTRYACFFNLNRPDGLTTADLLAKAASKEETEDSPWLESLEDEQLKTPFRSNPAYTTVTFCHASIGEYFRTPRRLPVSCGGKPAIGIDAGDVKAYVLARCSEIHCYRRSDFDSIYRRQNYLYAKGISHLHDIWRETLRETSQALDSINPHIKIRVGNSICPMFLDETVIKRTCFHDITGTICDDRMALRTWYMDETVFDHLREDYKAWALSGVQIPSNFLSKMKQVCAISWLQGPLSLYTPYGLMFGAISLIAQAQLQDGDDDPKLMRINWTDTVQVARSFEFEEDARWNCAVGMALHKEGNFRLACDYLEKATTLNPGAVLTARYLADVQWQLHEYHAATSTLLKALAVLENQGHSKDTESRTEAGTASPLIQEAPKLSGIYEDLGKIYRDNGQSELSLDFFLKAHAAAVSGSSPSELCIVSLGEVQRHPEIIRMLKHFGSGAEADTERQSLKLVRWLFEASPAAIHATGQAAMSSNCVEWLEGALKDAAKYGSNENLHGGVCCSALNLALLYKITKQHERAKSQMRLFWRNILRDPLLMYGDIVLQVYAEWCLEAALSGARRSQPKESALYIAYLEFFWNCGKEMALRTRSRIPEGYILMAMNLGRWYKLEGNDRMMREYMRETISFASIETQAIGGGDATPFAVQLLAAVGDDERAISVAHRIFALDSHYLSQQRPGSALWFCLGIFCVDHYRRVLGGEEIYVCRFCRAVFCRKCHHALQTMRARNCSKHHAWLRIPYPTAKQEDSGKLIYKGREMSEDEFVAGLREEWNI